MPKLYLSEDAINKYLDHIRCDYSKWMVRSGCENPIRTDMINQFNTGVRYEVGSKYIKVIIWMSTSRLITGTSVHSFIVNTMKGKFPLGSILKAASWKAPATNFKRGCILEENFTNVRWTGAM